jgi:hypothetical protein
MALSARANIPLVIEVMNSRVERLRVWFALQLEFADVFATRTRTPLDVAVTFYTNLHRRFGFGRPAKDERVSGWDNFVQRLAALPTHAQRIEFTMAFAEGRLMSWSGAVDVRFGCFSFDTPKDGGVRIHFSPVDKEDGVGPLSARKYPKRMRELAEMFAFIRKEHSDARWVLGGSWLYNLEAYRRLFPQPYVESLKVHTTPSALIGGSWWGQFLDHDENVIAERVSTFLENLPTLDPAAVWKVFPMPALTARAEIGVFREHYASVP